MSAPSRKPSERFEQQIRRIHELLEQPGSEVTWDDHMPDPDNPSQARQIDVTVRRDGKLTIVECRVHKEKQDVQWIEGLMGRRSSLRADAVIAVSASGFTEGAIRKAKAFGIILRDFSTLTEEEISSWGRGTRVWLAFYQFTQVRLVFRFEPPHLIGLSTDDIEEDIRASPSRLYGIFESVAAGVAAENPQGLPCKFATKIGNEDLQIAMRPVAYIDFSANVELIKTELTIPSVVAYDAPGTITTERSAFIQSVDLGEFEITSSSNNVLVAVDLSPVESPPNCKFHSVDFDFGRVVTIQKVEIIKLPPFRMRLQDFVVGLGPPLYGNPT